MIILIKVTHKLVTYEYILHSLCKMSILFCIISQSVLQNQWYLTLYTQILFSSTNLYLPGPFPLTLCIICAAFIAFMIQQHLLELGDINDASGVFFVIKRLGVVIIRTGFPLSSFGCPISTHSRSPPDSSCSSNHK